MTRSTAAKPSPDHPRRLPAESGTELPVPLYHRVYVVLRQQILEGQWSPDLAMPSEHELASSFEVSRITIRRALDQLEREGLILRRRGSGTFARPAGAPSPMRQNLSGLMENLLAMGLKTSVKVLDFGYLPAPPEVAAALEVPGGTVVQKSVRVRSHSGTAFSHLTTWLPEDVGRSFRQSDLSRRPLLALLEAAGASAMQAEQVISARLAEPAIAEALGVNVGSALLSVRRQVRNREGRVVEYLQALYQPELYEYSMSMRRISRDGNALWATDSGMD
jgi:GntR family transcriptional regulator